jgi:predicted Zn-dependent peptidase
VIEKIEAVTPEDVLKAARLVLDPAKMSYSAVGNIGGVDFKGLAERFRERIR